ncbi:phosphatidylserine/phosphatidylglycerophosphate/cardiolipin synthase family protein [Actinoplanes sp. NPDC051494]|uniref:phosphatidylserine/phosphatidylglycerophosphate/ cardiolipin synthase family protein n=1 Tax=Actinoplanes sp. NPDC051494 TaxID=3363907 RepID=UPI0037A292B1
MSGRRWPAMVAALVIGAATVVAAPAGPALAVVAPYTHAVFTDPVGDTAAKDRIFTRLVELIDGAETGSTIRVATYKIASRVVPDALVAAKQRGVNVQMIADSDTKPNTLSLGLLSDGLGTDPTKASFFLVCPDDRGCIANYADWSIMHNKFYLFTRTLGVDNVVVQTSINLGGTTWRDGGMGWNDALEVTGNTALSDSYTGYFGDLKARKANNNYYDTRVPVQAGAAKVFYYPRAGSSLTGDPAEDTVMTVLNNTECFGNTTVGTTDGTNRTIIRVTATELALPYIADKLVALDAAGCYVVVNLRYDPANDGQGTALRKLLTKTSSVYNGVVVRYYCTDDPIWIHSKYFTVEGKYYGRGDRKIVWTGSLNWKGGSLRGSDETMLQLEDAVVHAAYVQQSRAEAAAATHQPANTDDATPTC